MDELFRSHREAMEPRPSDWRSDWSGSLPSEGVGSETSPMEARVHRVKDLALPIGLR